MDFWDVLLRIIAIILIIIAVIYLIAAILVALSLGGWVAWVPGVTATVKASTLLWVAFGAVTLAMLADSDFTSKVVTKVGGAVTEVVTSFGSGVLSVLTTNPLFLGILVVGAALFLTGGSSDVNSDSTNRINNDTGGNNDPQRA